MTGVRSARSTSDPRSEDEVSRRICSVAQVLLAQSVPGTMAVQTAPGFAVAFSTERGASSELWTSEQEHIRTASTDRQCEFASGRNCVRAALNALGRPPVAIGCATTGEPSWPPGLQGSLSHAEGLTCAMLAHAPTFVGVDVERMDRSVHPAMWSRILAPNERPSSSAALRFATFSLKEAFYKLAAPRVARFFWFDAVRIAWTSPGRCLLVVERNLGAGIERGAVFPGYYLHFGAFVLTWVLDAGGRADPRFHLESPP